MHVNKWPDKTAVDPLIESVHKLVKEVRFFVFESMLESMLESRLESMLESMRSNSADWLTNFLEKLRWQS